MSSTADSDQRSPTEATAAAPGYQGPPHEATEHQSPAEEMEEPVATSAAQPHEEANEDNVEEPTDKTDDESDAAALNEGETAGAEGDNESAAAQPAQNNLIINYLPSHITENELRNMFAVHGDLAHVKVVYDRSTGKSMGYGFVKFTTNEAAAAATVAINGMAIDRKRIKVSVARPSSKDIKNSKLYVTNLPDHYNQDQVIEVFQQYGKIIECRTLVDPKTTISRCTAFVQFDTRREAKDALKFMNGHSLPGAKKALLVKFAEDHHRRIQRQEMAQHPKGGRGMDGNHHGGGHYGNQQGHQGKGKGARKGRSGRGGGGGGAGGGGGGMMYRSNNQHIGPRQHGGHMNPAYLNPMGMQGTNPDGSPIGQAMIGRYGMQVPGGPTPAQHAAAFHAQVPGGYGMIQLNQAMGMMNMGGAHAAAAAGSGAVGARADGSGGIGGGGTVGDGSGGAFGIQGTPMGASGAVGGGVGRASIMRGTEQHHGMHQQMLSNPGYGAPPGAAMAYVNEMKSVSASIGVGGQVSSIKHHHPQGGDRGAVEQSHHPHHNQQQQQVQQTSNHGQGFIVRGV